MATVSVAGDDLVVEVTGFDRFCALGKRGVTVPLEHVVTVGEGVQMGRPLMPGLPWLANSFPGLFTVGSYRRHGKWAFWVVHDPKQAVLITLRDEHYSQLVIEVDDPQATIALVNGALNSRGLSWQGFNPLRCTSSITSLMDALGAFSMWRMQEVLFRMSLKSEPTSTVRDLDQGHVIPNMAPPNWRGIWYSKGFDTDIRDERSSAGPASLWHARREARG